MAEGSARTPKEELAIALRQLRSDAGMSGAELAQRIGTSQPTISRYERGALVPSMLDAGRIAWAVGAPAAERRRVIELARTVAEERAGIVPVRVVLQIGVTNLQRRLRLREKHARSVATFHSGIVPGLLQTEGYMRAIAATRPALTEHEIRTWMGERLARQQQMTEPGRECLQLLAESALYWGAAGAPVMAEQCDHIARISRERPAWRVGVIPRFLPAGTPPVFPQNGFDLYDGTEVALGLTAGTALVKDHHTVASHAALLAQLEAIAVYGDDARAVLARAADEYRRLPE